MWQAQVFVSVLGASGYLYVEATRSQDLASWLGAHARALEFYAGAPRVVVPDYVPRHIINGDVPFTPMAQSRVVTRLVQRQVPGVYFKVKRWQRVTLNNHH